MILSAGPQKKSLLLNNVLIIKQIKEKTSLIKKVGLTKLRATNELKNESKIIKNAPLKLIHGIKMIERVLSEQIFIKLKEEVNRFIDRNSVTK